MNYLRELKTILVADDNPDVLSLFVELLQLKGYQVIGTAKNGAEAIQLYKKLHPNITFLDVAMPVTDGMYALDIIREIDSTSVVIMVTTDLSQNVSNRLRDLKATAVVYKPFDINNLVNLIHDIESDLNNGVIRSFE